MTGKEVARPIYMIKAGREWDTPTPTKTRIVMQTMGRTQGSMVMNLAASSSGASDALCAKPCKM